MTILEDLAVITSGGGSEQVNIIGHGYDSARQFYTLHTEGSLEAGDQVSLTLGTYMNRTSFVFQARFLFTPVGTARGQGIIRVVFTSVGTTRGQEIIRVVIIVGFFC